MWKCKADRLIWYKRNVLVGLAIVFLVVYSSLASECFLGRADGVLKAIESRTTPDTIQQAVGYNSEVLVPIMNLISQHNMSKVFSLTSSLPAHCRFDRERIAKSVLLFEKARIPGFMLIGDKYRRLENESSVLSRRLPDALVIGVKKSGTRALLEFIRLHPNVRAAGSEVHFFDKYYHKGFSWYRRKMPPTLEGQITMEKTPSYFVTKEVPLRVKRMNPNIKLLVVVRDPVTRAISDYTQAASKKPSRGELKSFEASAFVKETSYSIVDTTWGPVRIGIYAQHLPKWLTHFPLSRMLFISGERLIADPALEMSRVQTFLGLEHVVTEKHFYFNETKGFPCLKKSEGRPTPHCLGETKGRNHPHINTQLIRRLRDFYRPFNHRFYQMTGINFGWS